MAALGQEGPLPKQVSQALQEPVASEASTSLLKKETLGSSYMAINRPFKQAANSSPAARQLIAHKRALAKAVPQLPTFKPKINQKSTRIIQ